MQVLAASTVAGHVETSVRGHVDGARRWLAEANALLSVRPAIVAPREHLQHAVGAARNAAAHLNDIEKLEGSAEPVREALAAIMVVVRRLEYPRPGVIDGRARAAEQLRAADGTLASLEWRLGLPTPHLAARA